MISMGILDSLTKNPSLIALGALGIGLFVFRDKISSFFSNISGGAEAVGTAGQISQTALNTLQENQQGLLDAFGGLADQFGQFQTGFGEFQTSVGSQFGSIGDQFGSIGSLFSGLFDSLINNQPAPNIDQSSQDAIDNPLNIVDPPLVQNFLPEDFSTEQTGVSFGTTVIVPPGDEFGIGGGTGFIGGVTTFGDNLVDTISEVLQAFPGLTASQGANLLADNPGLTQSQFMFIDPLGSSSLSSSGEDPNQTINNSSGGFTGLTPEQIAQLLTGGNISNF